MALPVMANGPVRWVEHQLLLPEALCGDRVVGEARGRPQLVQPIEMRARTGVARKDGQRGRQRFGDGQLGLAAQLAALAGVQVPEDTQDVTNPRALIHKPPSDHPLDRVKAERELGSDAEIATTAAQTPQELAVLPSALV